MIITQSGVDVNSIYSVSVENHWYEHIKSKVTYNAYDDDCVSVEKQESKIFSTLTAKELDRVITLSILPMKPYGVPSSISQRRSVVR